MNPFALCNRVAGLLVLTGLLLAGGCAATDAKRDSVSSQRSDLIKAWKEASRQPAQEADVDAKPMPEPKIQPVTFFSAGALYERQGHYVQAAEQYRKAIELNPGFPGAYGRLGLCYTKLRQFGPAVEVLTKAAQLQPKSAIIWNNLGFAQLAAGNDVAAESSFGKAIAINPTYERARMNMALALVRQGRDADAMLQLQTLSPDYIALYNLGSMQLAAGKTELARSSFDKALRLKAEFPAARKGLEQAAARLAEHPATADRGQSVADTGQQRPAGGEVATAGTKDGGPQQAAGGETATAMAQDSRGPQAVSSKAATAAAKDGDQRAAAVHAQPAAVAPVSELGSAPAASKRFGSRQWQETASWVDGTMALWPADTAALPQTSAARQVLPRAAAAVAPGPGKVSRAISVADVDLTSLQWFAWSQMVKTLHQDIQSLPEQRVVQLMHKWLTALEELQDLTRHASPAVAMAR